MMLIHLKPCHICGKKIWPWQKWEWFSMRWTPPHPDIPEHYNMSVDCSIHTSCKRERP